MKQLMTIGMFVGFGIGYAICYWLDLSWLSFIALGITSVCGLVGIWLPWKLFKDYID